MMYVFPASQPPRVPGFPGSRVPGFPSIHRASSKYGKPGSQQAGKPGSREAGNLGRGDVGGQILRETFPSLIQRGAGFLLGFDLGYLGVSNEGTRATKGSRDNHKGKI